MKTEPPQTKTCNVCHKSKMPDQFSRNRARRDGLCETCRPCSNARSAAWRENNPQRFAETLAVYEAANPYRHWEKGYRHRARTYGFDPIVRKFTRDDVIACYGDTCFHCGGPFEELDHYPQPVGLGGAHSIENVRPCCASCNRSNAASVRVTRRALGITR